MRLFVFASIVAMILLSLPHQVARASPHFDEWMVDLGERNCAVEAAWRTYESPYINQPELLGVRELPLNVTFAAYRYDSGEAAREFLAEFEANVAEVLEQDRYLGTITADESFGFPDYEEASTALRFIAEPDDKSVHRYTVYISALVIQRGDTVSVSIVHNSYPEGTPEFLWDVVEGFSPNWEPDTTSLSSAMPSTDDVPEEMIEVESTDSKQDFCLATN